MHHRFFSLFIRNKGDGYIEFMYFIIQINNIKKGQMIRFSDEWYYFN